MTESVSVHSQPSVTFLFSAVTRTFHGLVEDWRETQTNKLLRVTPTVMLQVDKISWWKTAWILRGRINTQDCCLASMSSLNQSDWRSQGKSRPGFTPLQIRLNNRQSNFQKYRRHTYKTRLSTNAIILHTLTSLKSFAPGDLTVLPCLDVTILLCNCLWSLQKSRWVHCAWPESTQFCNWSTLVCCDSCCLRLMSQKKRKKGFSPELGSDAFRYLSSEGEWRVPISGFSPHKSEI